jgi:hypothetical protein
MSALAHLRRTPLLVERPEPPSCRSFVKEVVDSPRCFGADSIHLHQVGDGGALDRLKGPEVMQ